MDAVNTYDTPATQAAIRAEYALVMVGSAYLLLRHRKEVRWPVVVGLFAYNDLLGYVPGAIAWRRSKSKKISTGWYASYNVFHSAVTGAAVAAAWAKFVRPEWALLGIPLHIGGDRALFGNFLKPFSTPFEPEEPHPAWERVRDELSQPWPGQATAAATTA